MKNAKADPDNIAFNKKFILDGLKDAGIIRNDGFKEIRLLKDVFFIDNKSPRIEVFIDSFQ